jgi:Spy/CpxP family protein refolding chaperone
MKQILVIISCIISLQLSAQNESKKNKLKTAQIAMISQALDLDEATAQKFWPIYNNFDDERTAIKQDRKRNVEALSDNSNMSNEEVDKLLNNMLIIAQKEVDMQKKYKAEFLKVITAKQLANLFKAERNFKELIINKAKERGEEFRQRGRRFRR